MPDRVEPAGVGDHPGEERGLRQVELGGPHPEVRLGTRLHPVGAVAEVHDVEVALEDLVLGHQLLEPAGEHGLPSLPSDRLLVAELLLHDLLGDGRAALDDLAFVDVAHQGADRRSGVEPVVAVEVGVLDGQHGVDGVLRDLREGHGLAVDVVLQRGEERPVGGVDVGPLVERSEVDVGALRRARVREQLARGDHRHADGRQPDAGERGDGGEAEDRMHGGPWPGGASAGS